MSNRVLMVATVPSMIGQFNMNNIQLLLDLDYQVDVAADFKDTSIWPRERAKQLVAELKGKGVKCIQVDFSRQPLNIKHHIGSYRRILNLIRARNYSFIHTHTPIASAIVRLCANKTGTKVIYTAHGFHFYEGAPLKNWIVYYPIERWLSRYTDVLITINKEDYRRAKKHFNARKMVYIPGVGVDISKYIPNKEGRKKIRKELGVSDDQIVLLSVGELNENKNHISVIMAIQGLNYVYVIAGIGENEEVLKKAAIDNDVDLRLIGYRTDISDVYRAADIYVLPSLREGLNVSLMEAMAAGLPVVCGNIRGNVDLVDENSGATFDPHDSSEMSYSIKTVIASDRKKLGANNKNRIKKCDCNIINNSMKDIYTQVNNDG